MKGEWVMFRLKPSPARSASRWMLKKVTDDFADPEEGDALVDECVTSVTTGRTMAEIARARTCGAPTAAARKGGRQKQGERGAARSARRSSRRWSTKCRPAIGLAVRI
jgi:bifunctional non-homologous end joining protein LigD